MQFEHLIPINDPDNSPVLPLTRTQIWAGLLLRIDDPLPFLPGLESCTVIARRAGEIRRRLDFGGAVIEDCVTWKDGLWVRFDITPGREHAGGSLTIRIEEPQAETFYLRFSYETRPLETDSPTDGAYAEMIRSAYRQSALDTVEIIHKFADRTR